MAKKKKELNVQPPKEEPTVQPTIEQNVQPSTEPNFNDRYLAGAPIWLPPALGTVGMLLGAVSGELQQPLEGNILDTGVEKTRTIKQVQDSVKRDEELQRKQQRKHSSEPEKPDKAGVTTEVIIGGVVGTGVIPAGVAIGKAAGWANRRREEKKQAIEAKQAASRIV